MTEQHCEHKKQQHKRYRISVYFRGNQISRIHSKNIFTDFNFVQAPSLALKSRPTNMPRRGLREYQYTEPCILVYYYSHMYNVCMWRLELEMSDTESLSFDSCVRGHHVYKSIWNPTTGEYLTCRLEFGNIHDPYAVAVVRSTSSSTVGHIPRRISAVCHIFLRRNGNISCQVTGERRYSVDLPQGGMEVPCKLTTGTSKDIHTKYPS